MQCPGQNQQFWKPEDIFEITCPRCGFQIEFFKDDIFRYCDQCKTSIQNPRLAVSCAHHCSFSEKCLGIKRGVNHETGQKNHRDR